jgi:hypothetical protein
MFSKSIEMMLLAKLGGDLQLFRKFGHKKSASTMLRPIMKSAQDRSIT